MRGTAIGLTALCTLLLVPAVGHGHGREPEVVEVRFALDDPLHVVAASSFGLLRTRDGGQRWDWLCRSLFDADELDDPALALPRASNTAPLLVGVFSGLHRTDDGGCGWTRPESTLVDTIVADLQLDPGDPSHVLALQTRGTSQPDAVWRSRDAGTTWTIAAELEARLLTNAVRFAPSQPTRLWVSATRPGTAQIPATTGLVLQSDDDGATWVEHEIALLDHEIGLELLAVDPTRPGRLYLGTRAPAGLEQPPERLLVAELDAATGALTTTEVLVETRIAAVATDGTTVWVGGEQRTGLWAGSGEPLAFEQLHDTFDVRCLALSPHDGSLWMCGKPRRETFGLARSVDGGVTVEPMFTREQIERREPCGSDSPAAAACALDWFDLVADLDLDESLLTPPGEDVVADEDDVTRDDVADDASIADTPDGAVDTSPGELDGEDDVAAVDDAMVPADTGPMDDGCGCRQRRRGPGDAPGWPWVVALLALVVALRRRGAWLE